jgi:hypothetical protein
LMKFFFERSQRNWSQLLREMLLEVWILSSAE